MRSSERENNLALGRVDWVTVAVYAALVLMGWLNIYAAVYDDAHASIFDIGQRYGMQMVWIGISAFIALSILLIDDKYYHVLAYPLYWLSLLLLIGVLFFGKEVNGAKSWIMIGPVALQPTEFVKFTTALALARYMSSYTFDIHRFGDLLRVGANSDCRSRSSCCKTTPDRPSCTARSCSCFSGRDSTAGSTSRCS